LDQLPKIALQMQLQIIQTFKNPKNTIR
jgi:hypothetical protein